MGEWPAAGADPNPSGDAPTEDIPAVADQLWTPFRAPVMGYRERAPAPRSRWAEMLATVRRYARLPVMAAIYLGVVVVLSLVVARVVHTPVKGASASGTRHEQEHNDLRPHRSALDHGPGAHKRLASRPVGTAGLPPPTLSPVSPSPVSSQPLPSPSASSSSPPSPAPTSPSPVPTSPSPVPTSPSPVPTSPSPVPTSPSPVPTSPSPVPTSPSPVPTSPSPT
jgi:hypothetical protein